MSRRRSACTTTVNWSSTSFPCFAWANSPLAKVRSTVIAGVQGRVGRVALSDLHFALDLCPQQTSAFVLLPVR